MGDPEPGSAKSTRAGQFSLRHYQARRVDFDSELQISDEAGEDLLALDDALQRLAIKDREAADVVKLRYFVGLTIEETAEALGISVQRVNRYWAYARAWLFRQLR